MLHDILSQYLEDIEDSIRKLETVNVECYEEEVLTSSRVNIRIRVRFLRGHLLEVNEAIVLEADQIKHLAIGIISRISRITSFSDTIIPPIFQI